MVDGSGGFLSKQKRCRMLLIHDATRKIVTDIDVVCDLQRHNNSLWIRDLGFS